MIDLNIDQEDLCMFHDTLFELTGNSYEDSEMLRMINGLPLMLKCEIAEWGFSDTLTRELVYDYFEDEFGEAK